MQTILITGGTGMVGKALTQHLVALGYKVIILTRKWQESTHPQISYAVWDISSQTIDESAIAKSDAIIHLAGAGVADKRWTTKRKKEILESRTKSSQLLVKALQNTNHSIKTFISASAIGWYGDDQSKNKSTPFLEDDAAYNDFLGATCKAWEESVAPIEAFGIRLVKCRIGIVLANAGGAFKEFIKPFKFAIAPILGSGKQIISWIHIDDLCSIFIHALQQEKMHGVYNAVAPHPVSNAALIAAIKQNHTSFVLKIKVPSFLLKIMLGEMSVEVLKSCTVSSNKIQHTGFHFTYPTVKMAVKQLMKN